MTDAPKKTWRERRDELAGEYKIDGLSNGWRTNFVVGFDAGRADALKEAQVLVEALKELSNRHEWHPDLGSCICNEHKAARRALDKWKEEMGE